MSRDLILLFGALVLVILTIVFLYRGCRCQMPVREGFEGTDAEMTEEEEKLFSDLKADKFTPEEIDEMVMDGKIDQKLVEKFLMRLDNPEALEEDKKDDKKDDDKKPPQKQPLKPVKPTPKPTK